MFILLFLYNFKKKEHVKNEKIFFLFIGCIKLLLLIFLTSAYATNGDLLIGIGPISRSMGGVGIASPQDPISAVFANPAAMCFGPYCPRSEVNITTTFFMPSTNAEIKIPELRINTSAKSKSDLFVIPAIGISAPLDKHWRFGFAAYGISGMGVDYRNRLDINPNEAGAQGDVFTKYSVLRVAPNIAYIFGDNFSVGASIHLNYATLDLGEGDSNDTSMSFQLGMIYKSSPLTFGITYISKQNLIHRDVALINFDREKDDLKLNVPQIFGFGISVEPEKRLLIEANTRWINWGKADGYKDFDWRDQWVYAIGIQYRLSDHLTFRSGFNYAKNPIKIHNNFNSMSFIDLQGIKVNTFQYEYLRIIGFPAIVEKHLTLGVGYCLNRDFQLHIGYTHGFKKRISEKGFNFGGFENTKVSLTSELKIDTFEFGLGWRF